MNILTIPRLEGNEDEVEDEFSIWRKEKENRELNLGVTQNVNSATEYLYDFNITNKDVAKQIWNKERPKFEQKSMHFFAFQYDINSKFAKKFGFATIEKFWNKFTEDKNPCYYEQLIPERPCRPFYNFEFYKNENNNKDTDMIYQSFMKLLFQWFK
jgi:hypothetical protein